MSVIRLALFFAILAGFMPSANGQDLIGLYLTWNSDPTTAITINWVDPYPNSSSLVWYRPADSADAKAWSQVQSSKSAMGPTTLVVRRAELTKLRPDATYEFAIADRPEEAETSWRFRTMPGELARPIHFAEGGDTMHTREMFDAMNRHMQSLDPDFAVLVGDLAYENGENATRLIDWLESWTEHSVGKGNRLIPLVVGIGNHEVKGGYGGKAPDDAPYFYSLFSLPGGRSNYALDFGKYLSLIALDSGHSQPVPGAQADWLKEALAARRQQQFLFAGYHFPAYGTTKSPENGLPIDSDRAISIQQHWIPHFERYGVSAIFEHDHHNFKRSHRIRNRKRDDKNGLLYLGDGAWGVEPREVPDPSVGWWLAKAAPRNHLWHVELRPDGTWKIEASDASGEVFDRVEFAEPRTAPLADE